NCTTHIRPSRVSETPPRSQRSPPCAPPSGHRPAHLQEPHGSSTASLQLLWRTRGAHRTVNYISIISATIASESPVPLPLNRRRCRTGVEVPPARTPGSRTTGSLRNCMLAEASRRRFLRETSGSRKCAARVVGDVDGSPARGTQDVHAAAISVIPLRRRYPRAFRAADRSIQRLPERRGLPIRRYETPRDCSGGRPGHTQRLRGRSGVAFIPLFLKPRQSRRVGIDE